MSSMTINLTLFIRLSFCPVHTKEQIDEIKVGCSVCSLLLKLEKFYVIKLHLQVTDSYDKDLHVKDPDGIVF